jgi:hypothetical protein
VREPLFAIFNALILELKMDEKFLIANHLVPDNEVWVSPKTFENPFSKNVAEALKTANNKQSIPCLGCSKGIETISCSDNCLPNSNSCRKHFKLGVAARHTL